MILISNEIAALNIVNNPVPDGERPTTYDATVGEILSDGAKIDGDKYVLRPRGIVWVVSNETFRMPSNVTGLATLRTTWTHKGVLALNVGIVDPNWHGPLATALVNFGNKNFVIKRKDPFLRVLFLEHKQTAATRNEPDRNEYVAQILNHSKRSSDTFLDISSLADDVTKEIFKSPMIVRISVYATVIAIVVGLLAIFVPIAYGISAEYISRGVDLRNLSKEISELKEAQAKERLVIEGLSASEPASQNRKTGEGSR